MCLLTKGDYASYFKSLLISLQFFFEDLRIPHFHMLISAVISRQYMAYLLIFCDYFRALVFMIFKLYLHYNRLSFQSKRYPLKLPSPWGCHLQVDCLPALTCPEAGTLRPAPGAAWPSAALSRSCPRRNRPPPAPWASGLWASWAVYRSSAPPHCYRFCKNERCKSLPWRTYLWKLPSHFLHSCLWGDRSRGESVEVTAQSWSAVGLGVCRWPGRVGFGTWRHAWDSVLSLICLFGQHTVKL